MKLLQFIYTSCRRGLSAGSGFQTHAMSEGITEEERVELERITVYVPPMDLTSQPNGEEIASFPVAFSFFRLESGRSANPVIWAKTIRGGLGIILLMP